MRRPSKPLKRTTAAARKKQTTTTTAAARKRTTTAAARKRATAARRRTTAARKRTTTARKQFLQELVWTAPAGRRPSAAYALKAGLAWRNYAKYNGKTWVMDSDKNGRPFWRPSKLSLSGIPIERLQ